MSTSVSEPGKSGTAKILDGKALSATVRAEVALEVQKRVAFGERFRPGLAVVLVGNDPASEIYVRNKARACQQVGIAAFDHHLDASTSQEELLSLVAALNSDPRVHGILIQLPLPAGLSAQPILAAIDPKKDVDGLLSDNVGHLWLAQPRFVPCTPLGIMRLLAESGAPLRGANAVVIGRSNLVGRPVAALLLMADCTVTLCHSRTKDLAAHVKQADVVVAALGRTEAIRGEWIKPGATVIDVGINRQPDGKILGDVEFAVASRRAAAISPVPGGVGPLTIAMLLQNTLLAAKLLDKTPV